MGSVLRNVGAVALGLVVTLVLLVAVEWFSEVVHPLPADFGDTQEEMCQHVERYPAWVLAVVVPIWAGTALVSTWLARRLGSRGAALVLGALIVAALGFNLAMLPYPIWFKVACLLAVPGAVAGGAFGIRGRRPKVVRPTTGPGD